MIIRKPTPQELESTLIILDYQIQEQELDHDEDSLLKTVKRHMIHNTHCWLNAYENTRPVGLIGGYISEDNWTGDRFAVINFFYVLSSHRDQSIYSKLLDEFTAWAKNNEVKTIIGGDINVDYPVLGTLGFKNKNIWIKE